MRYFLKDSGVAAFNDLQITQNMSKGLTELTDEQLENHKSGLYEFINGEQVLKAVDYSVIATATRDTEVSANITVHNVDWQMANDAFDVRAVIADAELIGATSEDTIQFRLADNSWRETSLAELKEILQAHIVRKQAVWNAFGVWDAGDKTEAFEI